MRGPKRRQFGLQAATLFVASALVGCFQPDEQDVGPEYAAQVRWTEYGIPHVVADDWKGLGYGYGYAYARDNLCLLAQEIVTVNGQRSMWFGPDEPTREHALGLDWSNAESDLFYALYKKNPGLVQDPLKNASADMMDVFSGYAAGYNRWIADHPAPQWPAPCTDAAWVRPITIDDLGLRIRKLQMLASGLGLAQYTLAASPPGSPNPYQAPGEPPDPSRWAIGSNAYAYGASATADGGGLLLGNPHFPWQGPERFHQTHLTIPGQLDIMGMAVAGIPLVLIGFNRNVAWSHTVSTAWRFGLYELELAGSTGMRYMHNGVERAIEPIEVTIELADGGTRSHTFYRSHYGLMVELDVGGIPGQTTGLAWTARNAYTFRDANAANDRLISQFEALNRAASFDEFVDALETHLGIPWVNTIAASPDGRALYADLGAIPHVTNAQIERCNTAVGQALLVAARIPVLDGSTAECDWGTDADAPAPAIFGTSNLPVSITDQWVINSNDSHWLPNPDTPLEGFSIMIGDEAAERSGRTRMGYVINQERAAGLADCSIDAAAPCDRMTIARLQSALFDDRVYWSETELDAVLDGTCRTPVHVTGGGRTADLAAGCAALADWDRRADATSRGLALFERFWLDTPKTWMQPFDAQDPVGTPAGFVGDDPAVRDALANAILALQDAGIALDAPAGEIRYVERDGQRIGLHGADGAIGSPSFLRFGFTPGQGYTEPVHGNSYIQTVAWDQHGPVAQAVLAYSQSGHPDTPHYADQTRLYANEEWVELPFLERDVELGTLERLGLRG